MPVLDGFEASIILNKMMKDNKIPSISIVACTAHALDEQLNKCKESGMIYQLVKPTTYKKIQEMLKKLNIK